MNLWDRNCELQFFRDALKSFSTPEQLFYKLRNEYFAYVPKGYDAEGQTLQSRNSLIGNFTEKWCKSLFEPVAKEFKLYAVNGVICPDLGLIKQSTADLAFCTRDNRELECNEIKLIFEIKMSVVWNYKFTKPDKIECIADYREHQGVPSFTRSDSMLKAIGKAINIRVSGIAASKIPIIILGNSPMSVNYLKKVDFLKTSGVIQGFWSLNPKPTTKAFQNSSPKFGFQTIPTDESLYGLCEELLLSDMNFFSSMLPKSKLGEIIQLASKEKDDVSKAEKFLTLIRN